MWQRGETVVHQEVWDGRLWAARPLTVVEDTAERTLLWIPHGTVRKVPITPPTRPDLGDVHARTIASLQHRDWLLGENVWDVSSLWIVRPGDWYTILVSWRPDGSHLGWYINLQEPMRRNPIGFEAMDLMLDIVVEPDLSWRWKDLEEFDEILRRGIFDPELGEQVRTTAVSVIDDIENHRAPFCDPWPSWTPDRSWPLPQLPAGWSDVFVEFHRSGRHHVAAWRMNGDAGHLVQRETVRVSDDRRVPFDAATYVERSRSGDCFVCRVAAGASPRREFVVHRDEHHIAFLPNFHVQRGYVLIAPIEHREGVVEDLPLEAYLAMQTLVRGVGRALSRMVPTERIYVLSLGSQQGNAHVHWHVVALPPGVPYEQQQFFALMHETQGVLDLTDEERSELANELRTRIGTELQEPS